jgi:hypothetical protein
MNNDPKYPPLMGTRSRVEAAEGEHGGRPFGMDGYVRLHRTLPDWEWYHDDACLRLLIHLLMRVNWKPGRWKGIDVHPGSTVTSMERMADSLGWSRSKLRHTLDKLKSSGDVATTTTNHWTTVTLVNWAKYQNGDQPSSQPSDQPTANRWPTEQPTNSQPMATIEEGKKERREEGKKVREAGKPPVDLTWPTWAGPQTKAKWQEFITYRIREHKQRYKSTDTEQKALNLAAKYFPDGPMLVEALEHTMAKGWRFPVDPSEHKYPFTATAKADAPVRVHKDMTATEARKWMADLREKMGIPPGGLVESHLVPQHVRDAIFKPQNT